MSKTAGVSCLLATQYLRGWGAASARGLAAAVQQRAHAPVAHGDLVHIREHGIDGIGVGRGILRVAAAVRHACAQLALARRPVETTPGARLRGAQASGR